MNQQTDKAILVVSFGTSYEASRKATIEKIEQDIRNAFQDHRIYRAWTSKFIISILKKRDNYTVPTVKEALEQMITDGIREVVVQPTHILDGIENNIMKEEVLSYKESFDKIAFGTPLLADSKDESQAINAVTTEFSDLKETEALVFMGHGTTHQVNTAYAGLDQKFKESAHANVFIGTVEVDPTIHDLVKEVTSFQPSKIYVTPFMIVAGDHAHNDMAGDSPDSLFRLLLLCLCFCIDLKWNVNGECSSPAFFADHINFTIHFLNKFLHNGQTKTGSSKIGPCTVFFLTERFKHMLLEFLAHALSCIRACKFKHRIFLTA